MIESRHLMQRLAREIYQQTVDYEEYNSRILEQGGGRDLGGTNVNYALNYGEYAKRFINPGTNIDGTSPHGYECSNGVPQGDPDCVIYQPSVDHDTGQNPYNATNVTQQLGTNAFCSGGTCVPSNVGAMNELYLIDPAGRQKTMIVREKINADGEMGLAIVRLNGEDSDQDGDIDVWGCTDRFSCSLTNPENNIYFLPTPIDRGDTVGFDSDFVPITPRNINVIGFDLIIMPHEDPLKAFSENDPQVQMQPRVTVILKVEATAEAKRVFRAESSQPITLQATFSSQVRSEVESYKN